MDKFELKKIKTDCNCGFLTTCKTNSFSKFIFVVLTALFTNTGTLKFKSRLHKQRTLKHRNAQIGSKYDFDPCDL